MTNIFSDNQSEFITLPFLPNSKIAGIIDKSINSSSFTFFI